MNASKWNTRWPGVLGILLAVLLFACSCNEAPVEPTGITTVEPTGISTKVTTQPGDSVSTVSGMLVPITSETKKELVQGSVAIILGKAIDILPAKWGTDVSGHEVIYTDVIIQVERYLLGEGSVRIAVRVRGGRLGNTAMIVEDEPIFYLDEVFVVFLFDQAPYYKIPPVPPAGVSSDDYYVVTGSSRGKWLLENGRAVDYANDRISISSIETLIRENKVG